LEAFQREVALKYALSHNCILLSSKTAFDLGDGSSPAIAFSLILIPGQSTPFSFRNIHWERNLFKNNCYITISMKRFQDSDALIVKIFREKGYKVTPQRLAISRFMLHNHDHPSAQKTYDKVKKQYPTISLSTVYKTIKVLKEAGLVQELNLTPGLTRFDPNTEPHAHLVCLKCGNISDWMNPLILKLINIISGDTGFIIDGSSLDVNGICNGCQRNK
jgi:Fur family peroxide stress response transcriptional regulator